MKLKVCGMKSNPMEVARLQPDYLGFIFWEGSPRHYQAEPPAALADPPARAGVFVDAPVSYVLEKYQAFNLGMLQLHGKESPDYCAEVRTHLARVATGSIPQLIKAFALGPGFDFEALRPYLEVCDGFLFDSRGPMPGGNGTVFDWSLLEAYPFRKPYFLSGGIGPESAAALEAFVQSGASRYCMALDVNSKFETQPGHKDIARLHDFMNQPFWQHANKGKTSKP